MQNMFNLDGKVAIITGSSKGIGEAMAEGLAAFGAKVVISSRKQDACDEVVARLHKSGYDAIGVACHVGDEEQCENLIKKTMDHYGRIDVLINNAAINPVYGGLSKMNGEVFDKIMQINVRAPFLLSNLVYPIMKEQKNGSIIHVSSVEGAKPGIGMGLYSTTKAALTMLAKSQAKEWGRVGIRVNAILPGLIKTKFSSALWKNEELMSHLKNTLPSGRMAEPSELAGLAIFLASDASSYCTGSSFVADGGYLIAG
jgi:NAD(P)-dependent dehydrogenase (short-subunit alcohol dehydrogenase family)